MWRQTFRFVEGGVGSDAAVAKVLLLFVVMNLALVGWSGTRTGGDTGIYTDGASALLEGRPLTARQPSYLGYIAVVAFFQAVGAGVKGLVIGQVAAATLAAFAVYKLTVDLGGRLAGTLAVLLFAVDIDTNRWHAYVLADSLYMSVLTIAVWLTHRAGAGGFTPEAGSLQSCSIAAIALLSAALIRPEGWFVIPAAAVYWIGRAEMSWPRRAVSLGAVLLACAVLIGAVAPRLGGNIEAVGPGEMLRRGQTIWDYDGWRLSMPDDPSMPQAGGAQAAISYAVNHPVSTLALMAARLGVHAAHVRPFYSPLHNAAIALWLLPLYVFAAWGFWRVYRHPPARWCVAVIGTQALVVALTHADWDGRYLAHVLPLVYPFTACGLLLLFQRLVPGSPARLSPG